MRTLYLILALIGAVIPYAVVLPYFLREGVSLRGIVAAVFANPVVAAFTTDLLLSSVVFWIFMIIQRRRGKGPGAIPFVVINLVIGLCCALPAYLYVRERKGESNAA
jgi:hypothetical protein